MGNILHRQAKGVPDTETCETTSTTSALPKSTQVKSPSTRWTPHQIFYVFIMNGIGAFVISGGINLAIAYGMYAHVDLVRNPIRLWRLPNTLSGDAAVTLFVQSIITWIITMITVNGDLRNGKVQPIGFVPEPKNKLARWYFFLDAEQPVGRRTFLQWLVFVLSQIGRALLFSVPLFLVVWPTTVGILTSSTLGAHRGNDYYYAQTWTPQIFKLLYGGILGLLANPFFVMMWLLTIGWRERRAQSTLPTSSVPGNNSAITVPPPAADAHSANPGDLPAMGQQLPSPRSPGLTTATTTQDDSLVEPPIVSDTLPVRSHARL